MEEKRKEMKGVALGLCTWKEGLLGYEDKIWIPENDEIKAKTIRRHHDNEAAGHGGIAKTIDLVHRQYYWPHMREDITRYVKNCDVCQRIKATHHAPYGLLQPLEAPRQPWKSIAMDFVTGLPESEGYDAIWVVIDRLTKMAHFTPCHTNLKAEQFGRLFLQNIF